MNASRIGLVVVALALLFAAPVLSADLPKLEFEKYTLPNGMDVILHQDPAIPMVAVNVWYHVGSKNEEIGRTGFAHLFEHMMFQGSEHHDSEYFEPLEKVGGAINGSTSEDRTNYWENVPSNYLELALWLEADRMGFLLPAMTQEKLDNQRDVVKNERRQGLDNQPYAKSYELMLPMLYPDDHPYSWTVIGSMDDLSAASLEDVGNFFKQYYHTANASLCIAGDFDPAEAKRLVEKYFAPLPPGPAVDRLTNWIPQLDGVKRGTAQDNVELPRLYMAWHTPGYYKPGDAEFDLLANILADGKNSRLYKSLVYDRQIAQDVQAYQSSGELSSTFNIVVTAKPGHTLAEMEEAVDGILRNVMSSGVTADELAQAKTTWEAGFIRRLQAVGGFGGRADKLNEYNTMLGDPGKLQWDAERYTKPTVNDVMAYARQYLDMNRRVIFTIVPQGTLAESETAPDWTAQPGPGDEPTFTPPEIKSAKLSNGLEVFLVENHKLPLVQANLVLKSGWASDPADRPGAGAMCAELLNEGTRTRDALQISDEEKRLGASLGTSSSFDGSTVSLNVLKKNLDGALALMADVTLNPTFPAEELERQRTLYLGRIQQESKQPVQTAIKAFQKMLYPEGHPYAQPYTGSGTEASINAITREDLVGFYQANYYPNNAAIVVVGDITLDEAKTKMEKAFGSWKPGTVATATVPDVARPASTKVYIVDKPGAAQSVIVCGHPCMPRNHADWTPMNVMNNVLGGQFTSRINLNLREDKGYAYGAFSFVWSRSGTGPFVSYASVQTDATKPAIVEMLKEIRDIATTRPLTTTELQDSKNNLIKGFPQDFENFSGIAGQLGSIFQYELPMDDWKTYESRINAVSSEAATAAAKKYLAPDNMVVVVVGDRKTIEAGIRELNMGDVMLVDAGEL
ncbi:MAG TPA: pitrilysin family protein [candidate division Zixibacteria bacterium]|jgi:zinc protease